MKRNAEIIAAIENHSALKVAGLSFPERLHALQQRCHQIGGMIELVRRQGNDRALLMLLEAHRDALRQEIEGD